MSLSNPIQSFAAKFVSKCANGHSVKIGDLLAFDPISNVYLCKLCDEFNDIKYPQKEQITSGKFCNDCFMEIALSGTHDCY